MITNILHPQPGEAFGRRKGKDHKMFLLIQGSRASLTVTKPGIRHSGVQDSTAEGKSPINVFSNIPGKVKGR